MGKLKVKMSSLEYGDIAKREEKNKKLHKTGVILAWLLGLNFLLDILAQFL